MKLIVGLGNPGKEYENTRHNVGFYVVDFLAKEFNCQLVKEKFGGLYGKAKIGDQEVIFAKPLTYMNLAGDFVSAIANFFKVDSQDVLIIYDDMNIVTGKAMFKPKGSAGGQNGMKDIIAKLHTDEINRIKVGISKPLLSADFSDYVLSCFSKEEKSKIDSLLSAIYQATLLFIKSDASKAATALNTK